MSAMAVYPVGVEGRLDLWLGLIPHLALRRTAEAVPET
jgi:hypothetical protein